MCSLRKIVQSAVNEAHAIVKYQLAGQEENVKRLKTAFSAVLALSMALGMVVVSAGAADGIGCGSCATRWPFGAQVVERMGQAKALFS